MKAVVFLGPTLPMAKATQIVPGATFLPPAALGDLLSTLGTYQPDAIGLIDGSFGQSLSVWHKEILFALHQGIRVLGGASMGALRAVELESFGMQGIGEIYRQYRSGDLQDDDEVALVHAGADEGYRALSIPMVNLRATFKRARGEGAITSSVCERLTRVAKRLHFPRRTLSIISEEAGLSRPESEALRGFFAQKYIDVKASDARLLLHALRDVADGPNTTTSMVHSDAFERLYNNGRTVRHRGVDVPLQSIARHAALNASDFDDVNFGALNRALVQVMAEYLHVEITPAEVGAEMDRFRRRRGLTDALKLDEWRRAHDLTEREFWALVRELAVCRRLQRWLLGSDRARHQTRWFLDELRLRERYVEAAQGAAEHVAVQDPSQVATESLAELDREQLMKLVPAHQETSGWQLHAPLAEWAEEAGFRDLKDLAYELLRERWTAQHSSRQRRP